MSGINVKNHSTGKQEYQIDYDAVDPSTLRSIAAACYLAKELKAPNLQLEHFNKPLNDQIERSLLDTIGQATGNWHRPKELDFEPDCDAFNGKVRLNSTPSNRRGSCDIEIDGNLNADSRGRLSGSVNLRLDCEHSELAPTDLSAPAPVIAEARGDKGAGKAT